MVQHRVTHDPDDPGFPHGTTQGKSRGCTCELCMRAARRADKIRKRTRDLTGLPFAVPSARVVEHINLVQDQTGVKGWVIARAAGVAESVLYRIANGKTEMVRRDVARRILMVSEEDVLAIPGALVPADLSIQLVRSMQAQGWTLDWQSKEMGFRRERILSMVSRAGPGLKVTAETQRRARALADRVGGSVGPSARSALYASRAGWHPLAAYDERGNLIPEAVTQDTEEAAAAEVLEVLRRCALLHGNERIARETNTTEPTVRRYRAKAGLAMERDGTRYKLRTPGNGKQVLEVARRYEWDGWSAQKALAELGVPVAAPKKRGRPTKKAA